MILTSRKALRSSRISISVQVIMKCPDIWLFGGLEHLFFHSQLIGLREILYVMGKSMVSCRFSLKSTHWHLVGNFTIPTDFPIFQRGTSTTKQLVAPSIFTEIHYTIWYIYIYIYRDIYTDIYIYIYIHI